MNETGANRRIDFRFLNREVLGPVLLALLFSALAWLTWRKGTDFLIDFGRELYIPWQITSGKILYRDIVHLFGPLSHHFNALLFQIFGVSFSTLASADLVLLALLTALIYITFRRADGPLSAAAAGFVFLGVFAFGLYHKLEGNHNFISPYAHEATHGLILSALLLSGLWRFWERRQTAVLIASGLAFGLALLTKTEIMFSTAAAVTVFLLLLLAGERGRGFRKPAQAGLFLAAALLPPAAFWVHFNAHLPPAEALKAVFNPLVWLRQFDPGQSFFYQRTTGLENISANMALMLKSTLLALLYLAAGAAACWNFRGWMDRPVYRWISGLFLALLAGCALKIDWPDFGRFLPVMTPAILLALAGLYLKHWRLDPEKSRNLVPLIMWSVFAFCLLPKRFFNAKLTHSGFYLSLPAVMLAIYVTAGYLPRWLDRLHHRGFRFKMFITAVIMIGTMSFLHRAIEIYGKRTYPLGSGGDRIMTLDPKISRQGHLTNLFLRWGARNLPEDATFVVVPEGVTLNYLARRLSSSRYYSFNPFEIRLHGEDNLIRDFQSNPPDYFVVVARRTGEFGVGGFGRAGGFGMKIADWIRSNYRPVKTIGKDPFRSKKFGIKVMEREK